MNTKLDLLIVRCLLNSSLILGFIVSFWLIFDVIKIYEQINYEIEDYLSKTLSTKNTDFVFDETLDQLLDKSNAKFFFSISFQFLKLSLRSSKTFYLIFLSFRLGLDSLKMLLIYLIYVVIILFGFITTLLNNNLLLIVFSILITSSLIINLFIVILIPVITIIIAIITVTISWLYVHMNRDLRGIKL
jgi:hypothetical protein